MPSTKITIYHLEDTELATVLVKDRLEERFPGTKVDSFSTRVELEEKWHRSRPDAVILDLLVPEKYRFLAYVYLSRPRSVWKKTRNRLLRVLFAPVRRYIVPRYIRALQSALANTTQGDLDYRDSYWGGVEFLRSRVALKDQQETPMYIYSLTANEQARKLTGGFGEICELMLTFVDQLIKDSGITAKIFSKGYVSGPLSDPKMGDQFSELLDCLQIDLKITTGAPISD